MFWWRRIIKSSFLTWQKQEYSLSSRFILIRAEEPPLKIWRERENKPAYNISDAQVSHYKGLFIGIFSMWIFNTRVYGEIFTGVRPIVYSDMYIIICIMYRVVYAI